MRDLLRAAAVVIAAVMLILGSVGAVRWAKRGGAGANLMANALMLGLGMGVVVQPPRQGVEQAQEEENETSGESGDPPV